MRRLLARLLHLRAGPTPSRPVSLGFIRPGEAVDIETLVLAHNETVRHLDRCRVQIEMLIEEQRLMISRLDGLEGKPSSTIGNVRVAIA